MFLKSDKITIAYLKNNLLKLVFFKKNHAKAKLIQSYQIEFSTSEVNDSKIIELKSVSRKIGNLLDDKKIDIGKLIILLPEVAIFSKGLKVTPQLSIQQAKNDFISELPYPIEEVALKTIAEDDSFQLIAVEKTAVSSLKTIFAAEMADIKTILPLTRVITGYHPQEKPTIFIFREDNYFTILVVNNKTIFLSLTKKTNIESFQKELIAAVLDIAKQQFSFPINNVTLFNIHDPLITQQLSDQGLMLSQIDYNGDFLQLTADYWFGKKLECQQENLFFTNFEEKLSPSKRSDNFFKKALLVFIPILLIIAIATFITKPEFLPIFKKEPVIQQETTDISTSSASLKTTPTATQSATPVEQKPADLKVEILNGNGIVGDAANFKVKLQAEGFVVGNTANASNSDFVDSQINAKKSVSKEIVSAIDKIVKQSYTQSKIATLPDTAEVDIQIILGQKN